MCQEVFQILQSLDAQNLDAQLAIQCAPVITGLKLSNLLMVDRCCAGKVEHMLRETGFCCNRVMETTDRTAILVYDFSRLQSYLLQSAVGWMMGKFGYHDLRVEVVLERFRQRYESYLQAGCEFPHEMGLLLGYPPEDVWGFVVNKGENALYTGYWKVYAGTEQKRSLFHQFECAREHLIQLVHQGERMVDIIRKYRANQLRMAG